MEIIIRFFKNRLKYPGVKLFHRNPLAILPGFPDLILSLMAESGSRRQGVGS